MTAQIDPRIDHYKVLGVKKEASSADIKKAYRKLAKRYHPDSTGGDKGKEAKFKEISRAYDILGDENKRSEYDALRSGAGQFHNFQGFPGGGGGGRGGVDLGQIFAQMFQGGAQGGGGNVQFRRGGSPFSDGPFPGASPFDSPPRRRPPQPPQTPKAPKERKIKLSDGTPATLRGGDVHADLRLPLDRAILGTVVDVATLDGSGRVKVPPGTSSGVKMRLKGKGARLRDGTRGHHYATVHIDVPKDLDDKAKQLLVKFMQHIKR